MIWNQPLVHGLNHGAFECPVEDGLAPLPRPRDTPERSVAAQPEPRKSLLFELCQLQLLR